MEYSGEENSMRKHCINTRVDNACISMSERDREIPIFFASGVWKASSSSVADFGNFLRSLGKLHTWLVVWLILAGLGVFRVVVHWIY